MNDFVLYPAASWIFATVVLLPAVVIPVIVMSAGLIPASKGDRRG